MKVVSLLSGGLDSTVMLYALRAARHKVKCVSFDYGQRHRVELESAQSIAINAGVEYRRVDLTTITDLLKGSSQTDEAVDVPEGHYAAESMKLTVVPNRNMIMLSIAAAWAISTGYDAVAYAAHAGDHAIYPDCRREYVKELSGAFLLCDWQPIALYTPFIDLTKAEIVQLGVKLDAPFHLTFSCYKGKAGVHCGRCGTCTERKEAFTLAGVTDPTTYEA